MIWFLYVLILSVALTCQSVVAGFVEILGVRPDFLLVGVVFLALHGPPRETILAAWVVGLAADLLTLEQFGFLGLSYALGALLVLEAREYLFRYRVSTQFAVTATVVLVVQCLWAVYASVRYGTREGVFMTILFGAIPASLYTAAWAVPTHRVLLWVGRPLGFARRDHLPRRGGTIRRGHV